MPEIKNITKNKAMSHIKSENTSIEVLLRKALWKKGIRYRKNVKYLPGKPDIVLTKYKIAVFCDGELFHGKNWNNLKNKLLKGNNSQYWVKKIERNMNRDLRNEKELKGLGWIVLRFWGKDIKKDVNVCVKVIEEAIIDSIIREKDV